MSYSFAIFSSVLTTLNFSLSALLDILPTKDWELSAKNAKKWAAKAARGEKPN